MSRMADPLPHLPDPSTAKISHDGRAPRDARRWLALDVRELLDPARRAPLERTFVDGAWAILFLALLWFVGRYSSPVPFWDEWDKIVPGITGDRPLASWLWESNNEHRLPLPKLLYLGLYRLTHGDFRAPMFGSALLLVAAALLAVRAAARSRGRPRWTDSFFPLLLLSWAHYENLLWGLQIALVLGTVLVLLLLLFIARGTLLMTPRDAALAGAILLALPLCGAGSAVFVPALALWLVYAGVWNWRRPGHAGRLSGILMLASAAAAVLLTALVASARRSEAVPRMNPRGSGPFITAMQFLSTALGTAAWGRWPSAAAVVVGLLIAAAMLALGLWRRRETRPCAVGLLSFLAGCGTLVAVLGWGRSGVGPVAGLAARYTTLAAPLLCWAYLVAVAWGKGAGARLQVALWGVAAAALVPNLTPALAWGDRYHRRFAEFEHDLSRGLTPAALADAYCQGPTAIYPIPRWLALGLERLRRAGVKPFDQLRPDELGYHDQLTCEETGGWAWDRQHPERILDVNIFDDGRLLARVRADQPRGDLVLMGRGNHGFVYWLPARVRDGRQHAIRVTVADTGQPLPGTPRSIACPPVPSPSSEVLEPADRSAAPGR